MVNLKSDHDYYISQGHEQRLQIFTTTTAITKKEEREEGKGKRKEKEQPPVLVEHEGRQYPN
jgi:hypothetical protein